MNIERKWAMPSSITFNIKPIAELLDEEVFDGRDYSTDRMEDWG